MANPRPDLGAFALLPDGAAYGLSPVDIDTLHVIRRRSDCAQLPFADSFGINTCLDAVSLAAHCDHEARDMNVGLDYLRVAVAADDESTVVLQLES